jgi:hypothetical protein
MKRDHGWFYGRIAAAVSILPVSGLLIQKSDFSPREKTEKALYRLSLNN